MGKVFIWGRSAYFGKWRISHLRFRLYRIVYTIKNLVLEKGVLIMGKVLIMSGHSNT